MEKAPNFGEDYKPEQIGHAYDSSYDKQRLENTENPPASEVVDFVRSYREMLGRKILDIGSGAGRNLLYLSREGFEPTGIDISEEGARLTREQLERENLNGNMVIGDVGQLPIANESFDSAISRRVYDYNNTEGVNEKLRETARALKPGGIFFVTLRSSAQPIKANEELVEENQWSGKTLKVSGGSEDGLFQHHFTEEEVRALSDEAGFEVLEVAKNSKVNKKGEQKSELRIVLKKSNRTDSNPSTSLG